MRRKWLVPLLAMVLLAAPWVQAQDDVPASPADIHRLFDAMHLHDQMRLVLDSIVKQQTAMAHENLRKRYPQITAAEIIRLDDLMSDMLKDFPIDGMLDDMVPVYQKHLTKTDVDNMVTFYASATGKKLLQEMPAMTQEGMEAASARMQKQMDTMMDRIEAMAREDQAKKPVSKPATQTGPNQK